MNTIVIIITLQLFSGGVVVKNTQEINLPGSQDCYSLIDKYSAMYVDKEDSKLVSVTCKNIGEM